jgi:PAS domain S-box-containing protein
VVEQLKGKNGAEALITRRLQGFPLPSMHRAIGNNRSVIFANDSFLFLTGYDREEVLGQSFDFLMARPTDPEALAKAEVAFARKAESDLEISFRRKDGSMFWATVFVSPVRDKTGEHFASFVDLTRHRAGERPPSVFAGRTEPPHAEHTRHGTGD